MRRNNPSQYSRLAIVSLTPVLVAATVCFGILLCGQTIGNPTNLDQHPTPGNMDRPTMNMQPQGAPTTQRTHALAAANHANVAVLTRAYDLNRSGWNAQETILTPANVGGIHKLYSHVLPGDDRGIEAQPLIVPAVTLSDGAKYDLAVYATMSNNIFAYDANSDQLLWSVKLGTPITGVQKFDGWMINDHWGILSTPVVDGTTNILYAVTWTSPDGSGNWETAIHSIQAVRLRDGKKVSSLSLEGVSYDPGHGLPRQTFSGSERKQRASLALATVAGHKTVFIPFGTIYEMTPANRGWMIAYDIQSNSVTGAWTSTSRYSGGGIWGAGQAPVVATSDNWNSADLFFLTGNGSFDAVTDFGESIVRLHYAPGKGFTVADWWSPYSDAGRAGGPQTGETITKDIGQGWDDMDLGSSSVTLIPVIDTLVGGGKDGIGYSVDPWHLGKTQPGDFAAPAANYGKARDIFFMTFPSPLDVAQYGQPRSATPAQFTSLNYLYGGRTHHLHSTAAWFRDASGIELFAWGENGNLRKFRANADGKFSYLGCGQEVASADLINQLPGGMPGGMVSISSDGASNGIVWATYPLGDANKNVTNGYAVAYDGSNMTTYADGSGALKLLWKSPEIVYNKFDVITVSSGKVFIPRYDAKVDVYGF
jgi:hypothetical protein